MLVNNHDVSIQVIDRGAGEPVLLLPFLGRSVKDFAHLAERLNQKGFRTLGMNPRGIGESSGPLSPPTMALFVADAIRVIEACGAGPVHLIGNVFGGRVARGIVAERPDLVRSLVLIGAGGELEAPRNGDPGGARTHREPLKRGALDPLFGFLKRETFRRFDRLEPGRSGTPGLLERSERNALRKALQSSYFAPGSKVPDHWYQDWWPTAGLAMVSALEAEAPDPKWHQADIPVLIVQGILDRFAPPASGHALQARLGERAAVIDVQDAAHAVLVEQPEVVETAILGFYRRIVSDRSDAKEPSVPGAFASSADSLHRENTPAKGKGARRSGSSRLPSDSPTSQAPETGPEHKNPAPGAGDKKASEGAPATPARTYDVAILGGGFTGSLLGTILARRGVSVLILEPSNHPRTALPETMMAFTTMTLDILARRYEIPEIAHIASLAGLQRHVSSGCGVKRGMGFVVHQPGRMPALEDANQLVQPPFITEPHLYRQDVDAYLFNLSVRYGADVRLWSPIAGLEVTPHSIRIDTRIRETFHARYLLDTTVGNPVTMKTFGLNRLQRETPHRSRLLYSHLVNVRPYDQVHGFGGRAYPVLWHETTLSHVFAGGYLWVIPFNNTPNSLNHLCSVGMVLDPEVFPKTDLSPASEFKELIARFPALQAQLGDARPVLEWTDTGIQQFDLDRHFGPRFGLVDQAAGCVEDFFGRGLANSVEILNTLAQNLLAALEADDLSGERFACVERVQRGLIQRDQELVRASFRAFSDPSLWNAWFKVCTTALGLGEVRLTNIYLQYLLTGNDRVLEPLDRSPDPSLHLPEFERYARFWRAAIQEMDAPDGPGHTPPERLDRLHALLQEADGADFTPPAAHISDLSAHHFDVNHRYLLQVLRWAITSPPKSELKGLHLETLRGLVQAGWNGKMINGSPPRTLLEEQMKHLRDRFQARWTAGIFS